MTAEKIAQKLTHTTPDTACAIAGRRKFFVYRDLGAKSGSQGKMHAQTMKAIQGMTQPTGWHYHDCECQFLYVVGGWIDMEFETGDRFHLEKGDSLFVPGGMRHNEIATSDDMEILEVTLPSDMGTVPCEPPY